MSAVVTYEGYVLESDGLAYQSMINGKMLRFDTAGMWKQYIDTIIKR